MKTLLATLVATITLAGCAGTPVNDEVKGYCGGSNPIPVASGEDQKLCHDEFALGYNYKAKSALWAAYKVSIYASIDEAVMRSEYRQADEAIVKEHRSELGDYGKGQYSKGRLVPAAATRASVASMTAGNRLTNAIPQLPKFNRYEHNSHGAWGGLLRLEREVGIARNEVYVFTGPIYKEEPKSTHGGIPVPSAFYKIIYDNSLKASLSFVLPHEVNTARQLGEYKASIDCIESLTDIDFLSELNDSIEDDIENSVAPSFSLWAMQDDNEDQASCTKQQKDLL